MIDNRSILIVIYQYWKFNRFQSLLIHFSDGHRRIHNRMSIQGLAPPALDMQILEHCCFEGKSKRVIRFIRQGQIKYRLFGTLFKAISKETYLKTI